MKNPILLAGIAVAGLIISNGVVFGNDCSYYQQQITYLENTIKEYQDAAAGYSAGIASQMSAQGLSSSAIASSTSYNPYASQINQLQGELITAKENYNNCKYSSSSSSSSSSYDSILNTQKALDYVQTAISYMEKEVTAYTEEDYESAIKNAKKAVDNLEMACEYDSEWEDTLSSEYGSLGWYYCLDGEYSKGKTYLKKSLNLFDDDDVRDLYNTCLKLESYSTSTTSRSSCSAYGPNAFLASDDLCYCKNGYTWNKAETQCVTYDESCRSYFGEYAIGDPSDLDNCFCKDGYEFNASKTACVKATSNINNNQNRTYNNGFSDEYNRAYEFAYANRITTMPTIEQANMQNPVTRAEISKMLSNWVKSLGRVPNTSKSCKFNDISSVKGDLYTAIIESCQLGIMGQGITDFRPNDKITRGEVSTAISRIIRGTKYEGGIPFYASHMNALKNAGILNNISNPSADELRGNVMLILMRASNNVSIQNNSNDDFDPLDELLNIINGSDNDVIDYNDKLVDVLADCLSSENLLDQLIDSENYDIKDIEESVDNILNICTNSFEDIKKIGDWEGDDSLKEATSIAVASIIVYYRDFKKILPYLGKELSKTQQAEYDAIAEKLEDWEDKISLAYENLREVQKAFSEKFGFELE